MVSNGLYHIKFILFWGTLFINVFGEGKLQIIKSEETKNVKALQIINTETTFPDQDLILKYNHTILETTFNNLGALKHLTWTDGHLEEADLGILDKLSDLESLAFIQTKGNIILTNDILTNLTELKELVLHQNDRVILEEGSLKNLVNLQVLSADNQSFTSISSQTFKNCDKLQYLSFSSGFLGDIKPNAFQHLNNLVSITLSKMSLEYLRKNTFSNLPFLYVIDLSSNQLCHVSGEEFHNLPRLKILNLEKNFLRSFSAENIIDNLPFLNILEISGNKFSCVEKLRLNDILLNRNISSFEKRDLNRCHFSTGIQIFSA